MNRHTKRDPKWVNRDILLAFECFSCANRVAYNLGETNVSILCRDPCKYKPLKSETDPNIHKIDDIESYTLHTRKTHRH
jgi:hypothetical protein